MTTTVKTMFFGNPGTGKSSLINSYVTQAGGKHVCKSAFSIDGTGITSQYELVKCKDEEVLDTPGIADIKMNKEACKEIKKALQLGGAYRLVFVCLLVAGRVRMDDVVTINRVTDAIDTKDFTFTLVINKIRMKSMRRIIANANSFSCFMAELKKKPQDILFVEMDDDADDEDNFLMKDPPCYNACAALENGMLQQNKLRDVLLQTRTICILKEQVSDIKTGDYRKEVEQLKVLMNEMQKNHKRAVSSMNASFQRQISEQKRNFSQQQRNFEAQQRKRVKEIVHNHHYHTRSSCCIV